MRSCRRWVARPRSTSRCRSRSGGTLERFGVELIGANAEAIGTAENRDRFKAAMIEIGLAVPESGFAHSLEEALEIGERIGYPIMIRPSFILGGAGTGIARTEAELVAPRRGRPRGEPDRGDPRRVLDRGLEGVRARGDAGPP